MTRDSARTRTTRRARAAQVAGSVRSSALGRFLPRLAALNVVEGAMRLAAQAFLAGLPLLMTVAAFAPAGVQDLLADSLRSVLGVRGDTLDEVRRTFYADGTTRDSVGAVGVLVALASATAFSRALQAVCERCWRLPRAPLRAAVWRWPLWLVLWLVFLLAQAPLREGFGAGPAVGLTMSLLSATLLWWWTPYLLLGGRIGWRSLLPGAVLAGTGTVALSGAARLVLPLAMERSLDEFGPLGPVFTFLSWLIGVFLVAVCGLALGESIASSAWYRAGPVLRGRPPVRDGAAGPAHPRRVKPPGPCRGHAEDGTDRRPGEGPGRRRQT
ncbi:YhjD/YihY/BrkB family envelope integrity protein [Streptomyces sp. NPDC001668]|uniref:YhjD/YihY/BrkB family envelope integrity protein n=1 Tax=unclassified Streptomyces TaxID=2593676 RepID=UPI00368E81BD